MGQRLKYKEILTKQFLIKHYINQTQSLLEIAELIKCNPVTIMNYLRKYNIKSRKPVIRTFKNSSNYIDNKNNVNHYCIEFGCNNRISYNNWNSGTKKCRSCASKGKNNGNYKNGCKSKKYYCKICKNKINYHTALYGSGLCVKCGNIGRFKGSKHWNWQNNKTSLAKSIRALIEYKNWRKEVFKRDDYTCQECDKTKCYVEAHHIKEFHIIFTEFLKEYDQFSPMEDKETLVRLAIKYKPFWNIDNGQTLCKDCHNLTKNVRRTQCLKN